MEKGTGEIGKTISCLLDEQAYVEPSMCKDS